MTIAEKILTVRKNASLSQEEFAFRIGVSKQTVFKWENGLVCPKLDKLVRICEEFGLPIDYFTADAACETTKQSSDGIVGTNKNHSELKTGKNVRHAVMSLFLGFCFLVSAALSVILAFSLFPKKDALTTVVIIDTEIGILIAFLISSAVTLTLLAFAIVMLFRWRSEDNRQR